MTAPELPARVSLGWRRDRRLSFTGVGENRTLPPGEESDAIRNLLEDIYADAEPCEDSVGMVKPHLGNHFRVRWAIKGGGKFRFYLATVKKLRPKFEVSGDDRTVKLRAMVEAAYTMARTDKQRIADAAAVDAAKPDPIQAEAEAYMARLLAGEMTEKATP